MMIRFTDLCLDYSPPPYITNPTQKDARVCARKSGNFEKESLLANAFVHTLLSNF